MEFDRYKNKNIGIWGFGITGQSILAFLAPHASTITVIESKELSDEQRALIKEHSALLAPYEYLPQFLEFNDIIIPSPGVDLTNYTDWSDKFVSELDLFARHNTNPVIAITGSVGKTTTTTVIAQLLTACGIRALAAGNIGLPLLSTLTTRDEYDMLVLELSSFQLEYNKTFAPQYALLTNLFPNHLDRHKDMANYAQAKGQLFAHQTEECWAIIPQEFLEVCIAYTAQQKVMWLAPDAYTQYITPALSDITFPENWNLIFALFDIMGIEPEKVLPHCASLTLPEHRFENIGTHYGITFYNDSKATITESTLASLKRCGRKPVVLILGGLSKGTDRTDLIKALPITVKAIVCFGKEADMLHELCKAQGFISSSHTTLADAWKASLRLATAGDIVLFSPAGTSFDLFKNYEERGKAFKALIKGL